MKIKNKTIDFNKEKKTRNKPVRIKKLIAVAAVIAVIAAVILPVILAGETGRSNIADSFRAIPATMGESPGYPYSEDGLSLENVMLIGDKPLLLTTNGVEVLSPDADKLMSLHLDWADTKACSSNGRAFIYSNSSNRSYLISRTKKLATFDEDGPCVTGCVSQKGSVALVTSTDSVQSVVKVYTPKQEKEFEWNCSKDYVSSVSLSPNDKNIAISALGVNNAEIYSRVILFRTSGEEPEFDVKVEGTSILKVIYCSKNKIVAVGDNKTVFFNKKGEQTGEISYSDGALYAVDSDDEGKVLLCYKEFGGSRIKAVTIPKSGKKYKEFTIDYAPTGVDISGNKIAVSVDNTVNILNASGTVKKTYECSGNVSDVMITSTGIFTVENSTICKYR